MSTITARQNATWPQLDRTDRPDRRERLRPKSQHRESSSMVFNIRGYFTAVWLALYSLLSLGGALAGITLALLALPIIIFGPLLVVAAFLQAATWMFQGFGLV